MRQRRQPEIIAGRVTTNGTPVIGSTEFQSRRDGTGLYTLTFPPGFKVVACTTATWGNQAWFTNANGFPADGNSVAVAIVTTAGAAVDNQFTFVAVGVQQ